MRMIKLLIMISNGEEMPKKIKYINNEYVWLGEGLGYARHVGSNCYISLEKDAGFTHLNDIVEIIDEGVENE